MESAQHAQWILAMICGFFFVLTFVHESKSISIDGPTISIAENKQMELMETAEHA